MSNHRFRWRKPGLHVAVPLCLVLSLGLGLSACSMEGNSVGQDSTLQSNLDNQKKAASAYLAANRGEGIERIEFTEPGRVPGIGATWGASAVVTVAGKGYQETLVLDGSRIGQAMPGELGVPKVTPSPGATSVPVVLVLSDGSSEVLP
ncbi:hypothetical protein J2S90_000226 [Arthrobacter bambusae]|uniref:IPT/TIG domain-containing protein n=1 Tax=Arthrobacter bambusae TaxID=1338426 RepID=A0AAW8DCY3_9MICC|nr:hypothetical protein [Arthrobacter bambusae]MDQ0128720.1 hypothetical protein [Arthrobacter bambusae]MDQ0180061.1 hypothetical protein [Arthrobacter bambusae]